MAYSKILDVIPLLKNIQDTEVRDTGPSTIATILNDDFSWPIPGFHNIWEENGCDGAYFEAVIPKEQFNNENIALYTTLEALKRKDDSQNANDLDDDSQYSGFDSRSQFLQNFIDKYLDELFIDELKQPPENVKQRMINVAQRAGFQSNVINQAMKRLDKISQFFKTELQKQNASFDEEESDQENSLLISEQDQKKNKKSKIKDIGYGQAGDQQKVNQTLLEKDNLNEGEVGET
ncbi:MAG: hypothetical protein EZS28_005892 [Streblomastix strix]|uniref:Uncharacterized protein n=1 Tax=Streblomastix strix TaxID=222440 RepID=A0A5J4WU84_9EUKA|nr:MAG: hypothetical protein EZS28_005892 [Streblomastix strix]